MKIILSYFTLNLTQPLYLLLLVFSTISCQQAPADENENPNVILILADDLGYSDVSIYRETNPETSERPSTAQTPNIDALAQAGMRFTEFYCGAAVCSPSRSALLTGRNATRVGIYNWIPTNAPMHLRNEEVTIAEMLKDKDYQTGHFGKWHLTSEGTGQPLPNDQGYDYAFFTYNNANPSHENPVNFFRNGEAVGDLEGYACQLVVDEAIQWLGTAKENEEPFYINVWFNEPHEKVAAPQELTERHAYHKEYYGAIENMDLAVGRLLTFLEENELDKNTIVIFSSDNGSQVIGSNDPFRGEKCFNFEGGLRVPFIIKWPENVPAGKIADLPGSFTDVLPSVAGLTAASLPKNRTLDGTDLSSVFTGKSTTVDRENPIFFYRYFHDPIAMLREGKWVLLGYDAPMPYQPHYDAREWAKLKPDPDKQQWSMWSFQPVHMEYLKTQQPGHFELYNIEEDAAQTQDVAAENPEITEKMRAKMLDLRQEMVKEGGDWFDD